MMTSSAVLLGLILCAVVLLAVLGAVGFLALVKAGVIVRHAVKPTHQDHGNYTLDQGREVRPEEERQSERS
ncbi:MAG TPA: hypothetical protein VNL77_24680 [Roseiflexaceae bacterium]|nr:hypothetical protein [Roseiflexaceae bacterium]